MGLSYSYSFSAAARKATSQPSATKQRPALPPEPKELQFSIPKKETRKFYLKDGKILEGYIVRQTGSEYVVKSGSRILKLPKNEVSLEPWPVEKKKEAAPVAPKVEPATLPAKPVVPAPAPAPVAIPKPAPLKVSPLTLPSDQRLRRLGCRELCRGPASGGSSVPRSSA